MRLNELLHQIDFKEITADMNMEISGVCYDSRDVQPGNVFVAVSGYETDGFKYIGQAIKNGAAAVVCQHRPEEDVPFVIVDNKEF